jgi:hypothetical protein
MFIIKDNQINSIKRLLFQQQNEEVIAYFLKIHDNNPPFGSHEKFKNWLKTRLDDAFDWDLTDVNYIIDFIRYAIEFEELQPKELSHEVHEIMTYPGRSQKNKIFALFLFLTKIDN